MSKVTFTPSENWMGVEPEVLLDSLPHPVPTSKMIPDYYKHIPAAAADLHPDIPLGLDTLKKCMPFLDPMTTGYIIPAWNDFMLDIGIHGSNDIGIPVKTIPAGEAEGEFITEHPKPQLPYHPYEEVYPFSAQVLKFMCPWDILTPKGYSCLFTNPFNHFETQFKLLDAIVDTDNHKLEIHFPFVWTGFQPGVQIIKKGTPLVQVFPFKRESSSFQVRLKSDKENHDKKVYLTRYMTTLKDYYKDYIWSKRKK